MPVEFVNVDDVSMGSEELSLMQLRVRQLALS
jgi:hypothetical protein